MLTVDDESFWEGLQPVRFGSLPRLQDSVTVVGYPIVSGLGWGTAWFMASALYCLCDQWFVHMKCAALHLAAWAGSAGVLP